MSISASSPASLLKAPSFILSAILILTLSIGASTVMFGFYNALVLHPFPIKDMDRQVQIWSMTPGLPNAQSDTGKRHTLSPADYLDLKASTSSFEVVSAFRLGEYAVQNPDGPGWEQGIQVTPEFFETFYAAPAGGRTFQPGDDQPANQPPIVLDTDISHRLFHSEANAVGRTMMLDYSKSYKVVGAMGSNFIFPPGGIRLYLPLSFSEADKNQRQNPELFTFARLKPGVSLQQAQQELDSFASKLQNAHPQTNTGKTFLVAPLAAWQADYWVPLGSLFLGGAIILLLIGCANLALLGLAKSSPVSVSRGGTFVQFLPAGSVLALVGGVLGIIIANQVIEAIRNALVINITWFIAGWNVMRFDKYVLLFAILATVASAFLVSIFAAVMVRTGPVDTQITFSAGRRRLVHVFAGCQAVLAILLFVCGAVMWNNTKKIEDQYAALTPQNVMTLSFALPKDKYPDQAHLAEFYRKVIHSVGTIPDVTSVALSENLIGTLRRLRSKQFSIEGRPVPENVESLPVADVHTVSSQYFETTRIGMASGRGFANEDTASSPPVVIINETMARTFWPNGNAVGQQIHVGTPTSTEFGTRPATIIGIAHDIRQFWNSKGMRPAIYFSAEQQPLPEMWLLVRSNKSAEPLIDPIRKAVFSVDPERPVYGPRTLYRAATFENLGVPYLFSKMLLGLAGLGLILVCFSLYNSTVYSARTLGREVYTFNRAFAFSVKLVLGILVIGIGGVLALYPGISAALFGLGDFSASAIVMAALLLLGAGIIGGLAGARTVASTTPQILATAKSAD